MVKKISRIAALLAAGALLFGAIGCSDGGSSGGGGPSFTSQPKAFDVAVLAEEKGYEGVTSVSDEVTFSPEGIAEVTAVDGTTITVTSVKAGTTTMTIKVSGEGFDDESVEITIKVAANGEITVVGGEPDGGEAENYTLSIDSDFPKVEASFTKLDDTVTIYAAASGKSIQAYPTAEPPVVKMTSGGAKIDKDEEYGLQLTLAADATITITALSKETKTAGQWVLKGVSSGASDIDSTGTPAVASKAISASALSQDTTPATLTFASVPKGTYMLAAKGDGGYLFSLEIEYK